MKKSDIQHIQDLTDYKVQSIHSVDIQKIGEANGQEQFVIQEIYPEYKGDEPLDRLDMNEIWFDKETGERISEPDWFRENEKTITKYAQRISERNFDDLGIDHIPETLVNVIQPTEEELCPNVDSKPFKLIKDGYICELHYGELIKVLVNAGKLKNYRFYFCNPEQGEFDHVG